MSKLNKGKICNDSIQVLINVSPIYTTLKPPYSIYKTEDFMRNLEEQYNKYKDDYYNSPYYANN